ERPNSKFVARFIGASNVVDARHLSGNKVEVAGHALDIGAGEFAGPGREMSFCVKTHDVELIAAGAPTANNVVPGVVRSHAYLGSHRDYIVGILGRTPEGTPGQELLIAAPPAVDVSPGSPVQVRFRAERCRALAR